MSPTAAGARLEIASLGKNFRGLRAVHDVSFAVPAGAIHALIGPNGAGKTTIFNMIAGVFAPDSGVVRLDGQPISGLRPDHICDAGVGRTFQLVKPFKGLSVLENVTVGALHRQRDLARARDDAAAILSRLGLHDRRHQLAQNLTLPDRKRLEVARALAMRPRLLLLDEVMAGLNGVEVEQALQMVRQVRERGITIVLIEHVMKVIVGICNRALVLNFGRTLVEGPPAEVLKDRRVIEAYLGQRYARDHG